MSNLDKPSRFGWKQEADKPPFNDQDDEELAADMQRHADSIHGTDWKEDGIDALVKERDAAIAAYYGSGSKTREEWDRVRNARAQLEDAQDTWTPGKRTPDTENAGEKLGAGPSPS